MANILKIVHLARNKLYYDLGVVVIRLNKFVCNNWFPLLSSP